MKAKIITDRHTITIHSPHDDITIQLTGKGYFEHFMDEHKETLRESLNDIHEKAQQPKPKNLNHGAKTKKPKTKPLNLANRTCPICKNDFKPLRINHNYCSRSCASKSYNKRYSEKKKATENHKPNTLNPKPNTEPKAHYDPKVNPITGHRNE